MLLNKNPETPFEWMKNDLMCALKASIIRRYEKYIDPDQDLYLITWAPDPNQMPDASFEDQHIFNERTLIEYLRYCAVGLFCVEASQQGNPHYHGWYQCADGPVELARVAVVKTMARFAPKGLKITKANHYKIDKYYEKGNALYYYKKDIFTKSLWLDIIMPETVPTEFSELNNFTILMMEPSGKRRVTSLQEIQSTIGMCREFYGLK